MTKYTTGIFFVLTLLLWILKAQEVKHPTANLEKNMQQLAKPDRTTPKPAPSAAANPLLSAPTGGTNLISTNGIKPLMSTPLTNSAPVTPANAPNAEAPVTPPK
jgi:hypothetical protein